MLRVEGNQLVTLISCVCAYACVRARANVRVLHMGSPHTKAIIPLHPIFFRLPFLCLLTFLFVCLFICCCVFFFQLSSGGKWGEHALNMAKYVRTYLNKM